MRISIEMMNSGEVSRLGGGDGEILTKGSLLDILWNALLGVTVDIPSQEFGAVLAEDLGGTILKASDRIKSSTGIRGLRTNHWDHQCSAVRKRRETIKGYWEGESREVWGKPKALSVSESKWRKSLILNLQPLQVLIFKQSFKQWLLYFRPGTYHSHTFWKDIY